MSLPLQMYNENNIFQYAKMENFVSYNKNVRYMAKMYIYIYLKKHVFDFNYFSNMSVMLHTFLALYKKVLFQIQVEIIGKAILRAHASKQEMVLYNL